MVGVWQGLVEAGLERQGLVAGEAGVAVLDGRDAAGDLGRVEAVAVGAQVGFLRRGEDAGGQQPVDRDARVVVEAQPIRLVDLAVRFGLTAYDAAYLDAAMMRAAPLAIQRCAARPPLPASGCCSRSERWMARGGPVTCTRQRCLPARCSDGATGPTRAIQLRPSASLARARRSNSSRYAL